jgi:uncharacterized protein YndB with AHSA1/START domain
MPVTDEHVEVTRQISAPPARLREMVADVTRMGEWSPENESAPWLRGATGARPGATFRGTNRLGSRRWSSVGTIVDADPGRALAFRLKTGGMNVAEWSDRFEPTARGSLVTESWTERRNPVLTMLSRRVTGVADGATHDRQGMEKTLEHLATAAEGQSTAHG